METTTIVMDGIVSTSDVMGGEPRLEGRRITVRQIADMTLEGGNSPADVATQLDIPVAEVHRALAYYYERPAEIADVKEQYQQTMELAREQAIDPPETMTR